MNQLWLRHRNGGGRKFGNDCEVSADSFFDRKSSIGDTAEIYSAQIHNSVIFDEVIIANATIFRSTLRDQVRVIGGKGGIHLTDCDLSGKTRIWNNAVLDSVTLNGVLVYGDCVLSGPWSLSDCIRIHRGHWPKPPRHVLIEAENIDTIISECVPGFAHIGCWCKSYEEWFRPGYRQMIGKRSGWTPQQIELTFDTFSEWAN